MTEAGAQSIYGLFFNANFMAQREDDPVFVAMRKADADAGRIGELIKEIDRRMEPEEAGEALLFGRPELTQVVKAHVESGAPATSIELADLTAAFSSPGDAPVRIAILPGEKTRAWLEENLPALPEQIGGGETAILSRGLKWASITIVQKPEVLANFTLRCTDAGKAKAMLNTIEKSLAFVREFAAQDGTADWEKELAAIQPELQDDTISFSVNPSTAMLAVAGIRMKAAPPAVIPAPPAAANDNPNQDGL
jgi:hypothetical protein